MPIDRAIAAFESPIDAASTISARVTRRCSVRPARTNRFSSRRCDPVKVIRSAVVVDMCELRGKIPIGHFSLIRHAEWL
jgi:hypothetical protein